MAYAHKILIADPDADAARALSRALRQKNHQVHYAPDGSRALELAVLRHPEADFDLVRPGRPSCRLVCVLVSSHSELCLVLSKQGDQRRALPTARALKRSRAVTHAWCG